MNKIMSYAQAKNQLNLAEKVGQLFMPAAFINDTEEEIRALEKLIATKHIGSLCFFHSRSSAATNFEGKKKIQRNEHSFATLKNLILRYQRAAKYPLLIAIDAEWGLAMRIENTPQYPYAITLGAIPNAADLAYKVGQYIAKDCKAAGIHWNLAPCVDINSNPHNPVIGYRSFGADKMNVTQKAIAFLQGTQKEGILTSIKHFPGHGDTATDSHLDLPLLEQSKEALLQNELYPFKKLIAQNADSIMVGHLSVPALANGNTISSSLSKDMIHGLLRKAMGYKGVVISDALNMHAVSKNYPVKGQLEWLAFDAGNDILCFAENITEGITTILEKVEKKRIEESFERVWALKSKAIVDNVTSDAPLNFEDCNALNKEIAEQSITLYKGTTTIIKKFSDTDYCTLSLKRNTGTEEPFEVLDMLKTMKLETLHEQNILLLITPPQVKPTNNFGFLTEELEFINQLILTKNVVLYVFGNPYVLRHIHTKDAKAVVIVYQDFKVFQDVAAAHFSGKLMAKGKLPVTI